LCSKIQERITIKIAKYEVFSQIFESKETILYKAKDTENSELVILKLALTENSYQKIKKRI
jgi:hypothetical protein